MDPVFCVILSTIVIRSWWKNRDSETSGPGDGRNTIMNRWDRKTAAKNRRLTTDEVITVVLPTINNGK